MADNKGIPASHFVYKVVYEGALKRGADKFYADREARLAVNNYRHNRFNPLGRRKQKCTPTDMIEQHIQRAIGVKPHGQQRH